MAGLFFLIQRVYTISMGTAKNPNQNNVHEIPAQRHRVTADTFIDGDHADLGSDEMVELHPFGVHRFPKIIDNVVELVQPEPPEPEAA